MSTMREIGLVQDIVARKVRTVRFAYALLASAAAAMADGEMSWRGWLLDDIHCQDDEAQTYAVYVPSAYAPERAWPIVYCFDAAARGRLPVERLQRAAEKHGYIVVGSNNSRNGDWRPITDAANAMLRDTARRFSLDQRRLYAAGFSGGARVACSLATIGNFAGVLACSGGFTNGSVPAQVPFAFFGTAGRDDFNFDELYRIGPELERRGAPHRLALFAGGHDWAPEPLMEEALSWFDLQAMRRGARERDDAWIRTEFAARLAAADALKDIADEQARALHAVAADFDGLTDTTDVRRRVIELEKSRPFRRAVSAQERSFRDEADWRGELLRAAAPNADHAEVENPFGDARSPVDLSSFAESSNPLDSERRATATWGRAPRTPFGLLRTEPFDNLRRLATHLRHRSAKDHAAARALGGAFLACLTDGDALMRQHDSTAAARAYEAATLIQPDAPIGWVALAEARLEGGDRRGAREALLAATAKGAANGPRVEQLRARIDPPSATKSAPFIGAPLNIPSPALKLDAAPAVNAVEPSRRPIASPPTPPLPADTKPAEAAATVAPDAPADPDTLRLRPMQVNARPFTSFGMSLEVFARPESRQITRIVVREVARDSDAAEQGIREDDEIVRIDGQTIYSFNAEFDRDSDFGRHFVARKTGERIKLEIVTPHGNRREVTLSEGFVARTPFTSLMR
jgi:predicted esterase